MPGIPGEFAVFQGISLTQFRPSPEISRDNSYLPKLLYFSYVPKCVAKVLMSSHKKHIVCLAVA